MVWKGQQSAPVRLRLGNSWVLFSVLWKYAAMGSVATWLKYTGPCLQRVGDELKGRQKWFGVGDSLARVRCKVFVVKNDWLNGGNYTWAKVLISLALLPKTYVLNFVFWVSGSMCGRRRSVNSLETAVTSWEEEREGAGHVPRFVFLCRVTSTTWSPVAESHIVPNICHLTGKLDTN